MTTLAWVFLGLTLLVAGLDWAAVGADYKPAEYVFKPLTMVMLGAMALSLQLEPGVDRKWHVVAIGLSMLGDIFLMLPDDREEYFLAGLGSFLLAHIAYIVGMAEIGVSSPQIWIGVALAVLAVGSVGSRVAPAAKRRDRRLFVPVIAYMCVIGTMLATAVGTGLAFAIVGAALFCLSDSFIGWSRFVHNFRGSSMAIITTYHLGQIGLVLALLSASAS
jgi:uncharacterized membrane protein YhhN